MEEFNNFLEYFEAEKVQIFESSYIDYKKLIKEIKNLFLFKNQQIEFEKKMKNEILEAKKKLDEKNKTKNSNNTIVNSKKKNEINLKSNDRESSSIKEKIKSFFQLLDEEVKKLNIFYSSKEKDIYQDINKKIQNKSKIKEKSCTEILKEIDDLNYLNELCLQVLIFIYLNIRALKSILNILDNSLNTSDQFISYQYFKKFLSKNNSDLIYILSFKTLDETIISIQGILKEYKNALKSNDEYENDARIKYKDFEENINKNIKYFDEIHEKIFSELTEWKKYLGVNLDLPSSSRNSIFKETPFVGDLLERKNKEKNNSNNKTENFDIIENNDDSSLILLRSLDHESIKSLKMDISDIFKEEERISIMNKKILSKENAYNLKFFYILVFYYSYSYFVIIPKILYILENKCTNNFDSKKFYGLVISLPSLGSLISQQYILNFINYDFKITLIRSLLYIFAHYLLIILGIFFNLIYLIFIARFLLGLSSVERLCKIYIDICVPETNQAKSNQNYLTSIYIGYIVGLFAADLEIFLISFYSQKKSERKETFNEFEFLYFINGILVFLLLISVIATFKNPSNKKFKSIDDSIAEYNKENRLFTKYLDNEEKGTVKKQDLLFQNANQLMAVSNDNYLRNYSDEIERKKSAHFTKVFLLLILFLITSQYTSENNLMLLPRIFGLEKENNLNNDTNFNIKDNYYIISYISYILFSFSYLLSLLMQKYFLTKIYFKDSSKKILIILFLISSIIIIFGFWPYEGGKIVLLIVILGNIVMIIISEFLMIVIVNLFIDLLPGAKYKFICLKSSTFINIIDKISRLLPGIIYMIINFIIQDQNFSHHCLLGIESIFMFLSFIFCILKGKYLLKTHSLTRVLYTKA